MNPTLFAMATPPGRAAVAMVRISGPQTASILSALAGKVPQPRTATLRILRAPGTGALIDRALVLWFPGPHSYTGEDFGELHLHGGEAVVAAALDALAALGAAPAEPGAFTRRAFDLGKLDLVQAEAVADLIDAQTQAQQRQAIDQLGSGARLHERWRNALLDVAALIEASIDFPDEGLPETLIAPARERLRQLQHELRAAMGDDRGRRVRDGYRVAIVGPPNAGKSSLLNRLAGRDAAIVTEVAGTTRDVIEVSITVAGYKVILADTAGLRAPVDSIEAEGIRRARAWANEADLRLIVLDQSAPGEVEASLVRSGDIMVLNKADLFSRGAKIVASPNLYGAILKVVECSAAENDTDELLTVLAEAVVQACQGGEPPVVTRTRHRQLVEQALHHVGEGLEAASPELMAEDVRLAAQAMQRIGGHMESEQVLDRVFSAFCIGK